MAKRRSQWKVGDVFTVPQLDGGKSLGQVVDVPMPNVAACVFLEVRVAEDAPIGEVTVGEDDIVAALWTTPDLLDRGKWAVVDYRVPLLAGQHLPNERLRSSGWIGARTYGSGIIEKFLDAYFGLRAWDDWADPEYLDKLLISPEKKPANVILVRS